MNIKYYKPKQVKKHHLSGYEKRLYRAIKQYEKHGYFTTTIEGRLQIDNDNPFEIEKNIYGNANYRHYYDPREYRSRKHAFTTGEKLK